MTDKRNGGAYYHGIKGLSVPRQAPGSIEHGINQYIGTLGQCTERLDENFNRNDANGVVGALETIQAMLQAVFAKQCVSYASALISCAKTRGLDECRRLLPQAVAEFFQLSVEMQTAQALGPSHVRKAHPMEINEEIARGFSAVIRLTGIGDYQAAQDMASDMKDMDGAFVKLTELLRSGRYDSAKELADATEKEYIGHIQRVSTDTAVKTVMAVDDRPEILSNMNAALRGHYKVLGAPGGKIALAIMPHQKTDLFFLDIEMPEMDGFELARRIRADSAYADTPIIFLTGNAPKEHIVRGIGLGIHDFVVKPSNHISLLVKARSYLDNEKRAGEN